MQRSVSCCTLADWQEYVAKPVSGNPILIFSLAVSFASPLLKMLGSGETGGFHFHGITSSGKTTGLMVGASSWGSAAPPSNNSGDSFINTWKTTGQDELEDAYQRCIELLFALFHI
jgi:putative DNA primase/helicase